MARKNIVPLLGRPLLAYTLNAALESRLVSRVVVSTDDPEIAAIARQLGGEVPFLRPPGLARDETPALPVVKHAVDWLEREEDWRPDLVAYLQPTSPLRRAEHIDRAISILLEQGADSIVSVLPVPHCYNPLSVMRLEDGCLIPFIPQEVPLHRRQDKPTVLARNGPAVLVSTRRTLMDEGRLYGARTVPLLMDAADSVDIDDDFDLKLAEWILGERSKKFRKTYNRHGDDPRI